MGRAEENWLKARIAAAEAKGYLRALGEVQRRLLELAPISRGFDGETCLKLAVKEVEALKEKGRSR
jgi:hypothetical protein